MQGKPTRPRPLAPPVYTTRAASGGHVPSLKAPVVSRPHPHRASNCPANGSGVTPNTHRPTAMTRTVACHTLWPLASATSRSEDHRVGNNIRQGAPRTAPGAARVSSSGAAAALTWRRGHCQPCALAPQRQRPAREQRPTAATAPVLQQKAKRTRDQDVVMSHKPCYGPREELPASANAGGETSKTFITKSGKKAAASCKKNAEKSGDVPCHRACPAPWSSSAEMKQRG